jgi:hypothetical protein
MVSEPVAPSLPHAWTPPDTPSPQAVAGSTGVGAPVRRAAPVQRSNPAAGPGPWGEVHRVSVVEPPPPPRTPSSAPDNPHLSRGGPLVGAPVPSSTTTPVDDAAVQRACAPATSIAAWRTPATPAQRLPGRGLEEQVAPPAQPPPIRTMSLQQMFEPVQETSPGPGPSAPAADASAPVQREPAPGGPAAATATSTTPSGPVAAGAAGSVNTDELATRLYEPLVARIKAELWLDRERAGVLTDPRY